MAATADPLPDLPKIGITYPKSTMARKAFAYSKQHCEEAIHNHSVRSSYFALLLLAKMPQYASYTELDREAVVVACLLHDMGLAKTKALLTKDKRFEVDSANITRDFVKSSSAPSQPSQWDRHRLQLMWDAVAFHTAGSLALHKEPEVSLSHLAILVDFAGPAFPGGFVTLEEWRAVVAEFPRTGFNFKSVVCGLCREKPDTTYDNMIGRFGLIYGTDGEGGDKEEYRGKYEKAQPVGMIVSQLAYLDSLEAEYTGA